MAEQKKIQVTALGELLIDFTQNGVTEQGNPLFEANPGGAPCNVLSMLSRLGRRTAFIGKVGDDMFGRQLSDALKEVGIGTEGLCLDAKANTTLAIVHRLESGDRDFSFYRKPGADMLLREDEVDTGLIREAEIFHFGSLSLTDEPVRTATHEAIAAAEKYGVLRSFDPNLRPPLWENLDEARTQIGWGLAHCDILKISDNEIQWFTGCEDYTEGVAALKKEYDIRLICVSMGNAGSRAYYDGRMVEAPAFIQTGTIETTGAGDTFCACVLHHVLKYGLDGFDEKKLKDMLNFSNGAASIVTTKKGALRVMPNLEQIETLIKSRI